MELPVLIVNNDNPSTPQDETSKQEKRGEKRKTKPSSPNLKASVQSWGWLVL